MNYITLHFTMEEFIATNHRNIDNTLPMELYGNAFQTCEMMERIRSYLSKVTGRDTSINPSSAYRCLQLNRAVGSSDSSDHVKALAMDWNAQGLTPFEVCRLLEPVMNELGIGQLIHEYGRWVHTGVNKPSKPINRIITISKQGTIVGIQNV